MRYKIWADGAYKSSIEQGGIGIVWTKNGKIVKTYSKGYKKNPNNKITNQTMEMLAVMVALNSIKKPVKSIEIVSDSMYVVGTLTKDWKRRANRGLWAKFDSILKKTQELCEEKIKFTHTYGHAEDEFNNIADELADTASKELLL